MTPESLIIAGLILPLVAVLWVVVFGKSPNVREAGSVAVAVALFVLNCILAGHVFGGAQPEVVLGEMLPGFPIAFQVEPLGMLFALVASGLWILTTIYAIGYMRGHHEINQTRFFALSLIHI